MQDTLPDYLKKHGVVAIAGIDTRKLTRILREKGAQAGCIMAVEVDEAKLLLKLRPSRFGGDGSGQGCFCGFAYVWSEGEWTLKAATKRRQRPVFMLLLMILVSSATFCVCWPVVAAR